MSNSSRVESAIYCLPVENIDTDQIIPARFLTTTERDGMGQYCFHDWRFNDDGSEKASHPFSDYQPETTKVLVAGQNFGCGSSREHAPWALIDFGFSAVISSRFADIFRSNSLKNGLLPVTVDEQVVQYLMQHPDSHVTIDVAERTLQADGIGTVEFPLDPFSAYCLMRGMDQLDYILQHEANVVGYERDHGK